MSKAMKCERYDYATKKWTKYEPEVSKLPEWVASDVPEAIKGNPYAEEQWEMEHGHLVKLDEDDIALRETVFDRAYFQVVKWLFRLLVVAMVAKYLIGYIVRHNS